MKRLLAGSALFANLVACSPEDTNTSKVKAAEPANLGAAIATVNAAVAPAIYSSKSFDKNILEAAMFDFMVCKGLAAESQVTTGFLGIGESFKIKRIVDHKNFSLIVSNLAFTENGEIIEEIADNWNFVAYSEAKLDTKATERQAQLDAEIAAINADEKTDDDQKISLRQEAKRKIPCEYIHKKSSDGNFTTPVFAKFEDLVAMPKLVKAGFESQPSANRRGFWYAEFKDAASILDLMKSLYSGQPFSGMTLTFPRKPAGKLSWDPTPGRKWKAETATYSFGRGSITAEYYDGFADLFDQNYNGAAKGSEYKMMPWSTGALRQIMVGDKLVEVLSDELAKEYSKRIGSESSSDDGEENADVGIGIGQ